MLAIWVNLFSYTQAMNQIGGLALPLPPQLDSVSRGLKELSIWACAAVGLRIWSRRHGPRPALPTVVLLAGTYALLLFFYAIVLAKPPVQIIGGIRIVALIAIAAGLASLSRPELLQYGRAFTRSSLLLVAIQLGLSLLELSRMRPQFGETLVGPRVMGSFSSPNNMGVAILGILLADTALTKRPSWPLTGLTAGCALFSGSRTAIIGLAAYVLAITMRRIQSRLVLVLPAAGMGYAVYSLASRPEFSGRVITGEGRLNTWASALNTLGSPFEWAFGAGLGALSNTAVTYGGQSVLGQVADSTLVTAIGSYGLLGAGLLGFFFLTSWLGTDREVQLLCLPAILIAVTSFNVLELPLFNLTVAIASGAALAWQVNPQDHGQLVIDLESATRSAAAPADR